MFGCDGGVVNRAGHETRTDGPLGLMLVYLDAFLVHKSFLGEVVILFMHALLDLRHLSGAQLFFLYDSRLLCRRPIERSESKEAKAILLLFDPADVVSQQFLIK